MTLRELIRKEIYIRMADRPTRREQEEYDAIKKQLALYDKEQVDAEYNAFFEGR